jgi:hypothetical protein
VVVYRTEWNGLDTFCPTDAWLECDGTRLDLGELGWAWGQADLDALEAAGRLRKLWRRQDPSDEFESSTFYLADERVEDGAREASSLLEATRLLLCDPSNSFATSRWKDTAAAQADVERLIRQLRAGVAPELGAWFAPAGDLHRVGAASGWGVVCSYVTERFQRTALVASWERRRAILAGVAVASGALLLILFLGAIGLPPNSLSEHVKDWLLVRQGFIDTQEIVWLGLLSFFLVGVPAWLGLVFLASRLGGVTYAGRQLDALAQGARSPSTTVRPVGAPDHAGAGAEPRGRWAGPFTWPRAALATAALSAAAFGALFAFDGWDSAIEPEVVELGSAGKSLSDLPRHVEVHATALRDLRSVIQERTTGAAQLTNTRTWFSGVGQDVKTLGGSDERIVPLARASWGPGEAIDLFWRGGRLDGELDGDKRGQVSLRGTLRRRGLPLFAVNSYRRAGVLVADPYYVLDPELSLDSRASRRWAVLVIGLLCAMLLLAWPLLAGAARRRRQRRGSP